MERRTLLSAVPTSITVSASANSAVYGQAVNLTANVSASPAAPSEGNVAFYDNGTLLATEPVISGVAALDSVDLPTGTEVITASYSDVSGNFAASSTVVTPQSTIETVAGGVLQNGLPAVDASISPRAVAVDSSGDVFFADDTLNVVFEVNHATGAVTTVAGNGTPGVSGDGGPATAAQLDWPEGVAVDSSGHLFIADTYNNRIREVDLSTGVITTVAGNGTSGFSGDGGQATSAELGAPQGVAVNSSGDLFIADNNNNRIREVDHATGIITTVAGNGTAGFSGDAGSATAAELSYPEGIAVDSSGNLFIADTYNKRIREVNVTTGVITTFAGNGTYGNDGDGGPATAAELFFPDGVAVDSSGDLFIEGDNRIREVNHTTGVINTAVGNAVLGFSGDGGPATAAQLFYPEGIAVDSSGDLFIADNGNDRIREVIQATGIIDTVAGNGTRAFSGDGGPAAAAEVDWPQNIAVDSSGDLFIADSSNNRIREVNHATGVITTIAGNGRGGFGGYGGFGGDGGPATAAYLDNPQGIAVDSSGELFIADTYNNRIREVNLATGIIATVAGNGTGGFGGDGGPATAAELSYPRGVTVDSSGHLFFTDTINNRIREVNLATGIITTVAGNGMSGFSGDGGPATAAELDNPQGVAVDSSGDLFIADNGVREVNLATGIIATVAGNGLTGFSGDGGPATSAELHFPTGISVDPSGDLFIADTGNNRVREVNLATSIITTVAGNGTAGFSGDGGPASAAEFSVPVGVGVNPSGDLAVDSSGDLFIADIGNNRIREVATGTVIKVTPAPLTITADDKTKLYGTALPTLTASYSGFVNGDTAASLTTQPTLLTTATAGSHVSGSPYTIAASGAIDPNYTISYVPGNLTITPAPLTVTGSGRQVYGGSPTFDAGYSGFVLGQNSSVLGGTLAFATTTTSASPAGTYAHAVTPSGLTSTDYAITFTAGDMLVVPAPPTVATGAATSVSSSGATLNGTVNPEGTTATARFQVSADPGFPDTVETVLGPGFFQPRGMAVDAAGDVFVSNFGSSTITEILPNGTTRAIGSGFSSPDGVALDASGDLFVADTGHSAVKEILPDGTIKTIGSGFNGPFSVAVDGAGDVFVADTDNNAVKEVLPNGTIKSIGSGYNNPFSVAVDASGDVFVADTDNNAVKEILTNGSIRTLGSGLIAPEGVALDASGDVFVGDFFNNAVNEILPNGAIKTLGSGFSGPTGVAVDSAGDVFVGDTLNDRVVELSPLTVSAAPATLTGSTSTAVSGALVGLTPGTMYYYRLVAASAGGTVADPTSPPQSFMTLKSPMVATGAATSVSSSGATLNGTVNPEDSTTSVRFQVSTDPSFDSIVATTLGSGFYNPSGVAVDAAGDVFVADHNAVREILPNGTIDAVGSGFSHPDGVGLDALGDVFVADTGNNAVKEVLPSGAIKTIGSGFSYAYGVAVDASGDVFVADTDHFEVKEILPNGTIKTISSGVGLVYGVAVDSSGDVFVADSSNTAAKEIRPNGAVETIGSRFFEPVGVAVDAAGDVFVADLGNNAVKEVLPDGTINTIGSAGFNQPAGVAVDGAGDVFVGDDNNNAVKEILPSGTIETLGFGFNHPAGVAVDAAGDVFVADQDNNAVKEVLPNGTIKTVGSGYTGPSGVAVDASGDVFVADYGDSAVKEVLPNGAIKIIGSGFSYPLGVAVDASGDVFVSDTFDSAVKEVLPNGVIKTIGSGFSAPAGLAVDGTGDVFVADHFYGAIKEVMPNGTIKTLGSGFSLADSVAVDAAGDVFVADTGNSRVVELGLAASPSPLSGSTTTAVSGRLAGLVPGTTYYYRTVAVSAGGTVDGPTMEFTTPTITWAYPAGITYGTALGATQLDASASIPGTFSYTLTDGTTAAAGAVLDAGQNQVLIGTFKPTDSTHYATDTVRVAINVTPVALTITGSGTQVYGGSSAFSAAYSGFVLGQDSSALGGTLAFATTTSDGSDVGIYKGAVTPSGLTSTNYAINFIAGSMVVTPAPLTISADDKSKVYGASLPTFTATYSGFVNGDTAASLATPPTLTTTATAGSHVSGSPYTITASGAVDPNYTISYVPGNLTIAPAPLTITADDKSKVYGTVLPTLTASYSGFINGDTAATLTTQPTLSTSAMDGSHVSGSPYTITASGAADPDYTISYKAGALTVAPAPLTVMGNGWQVYGGSPTFTPTYSGFVLDQNSSVLGGTLAFATTTTSTSPVGTYPNAVTPSGLTSTDYAITFTAGDMLVMPPPPTVAMGAPTSVSPSGATLNGTVNPEDSTTSVRFQVSTSPTFTPTVETTIGSAGLDSPDGVAVDAAGDIFVSDKFHNAVKEFLPNGTIKVIGSGFIRPGALALDKSGDLYVNDGVIKEVLPSGAIKTIGSGLDSPSGLAVDAAGDVFVTDPVKNYSAYSAVKEVLPNGTIKTIGPIFDSADSVAVDAAGDIFVANFIPDSPDNPVEEILPNGTIKSIGSGLSYPIGMAVDSSGDVFVVDSDPSAVSEVLPNGTIKTIGSGFDQPWAVAVDASGDVFVADSSNNAVKEVLPTGAINTIGSGFSNPTDVTVDGAGDVFVSDSNYSGVEEFLPDGTIETIGPGIRSPFGVVVDSAGDVFIADTYDPAVKEVLRDGTIKTFNSGFFIPTGVAVDAAGDLEVSDYTNNAVREVLPNGTVKTVSSSFYEPCGLAVDTSGNLFVADQDNNAVKEVLPNGTVKTIGTGFYLPHGVAVDSAGDVFVADTGNNTIKEVLPNGTIKTIGSGFSQPQGVAVDSAGDIFVADTGNGRIVELSAPVLTATPSPLNGSNSQPISCAVTGLTAGTTYYVRAVASSAGGSVVGGTVEFTTPTITWDKPADITYGTALGATQLDAMASIAGTFTYTLADGTTPAAGAVLGAGHNQVLIATFTPTDSTHYATDTVRVAINVTPAALTVTGSGTQIYGGSPVFSATYKGFVLGQDSSVLGGTLAFATTTSDSSEVGRYTSAVTPSGLTSTNYIISFSTGDMVVTPASLTITADDKSKVYGAALPTLTASYSGFVNGDSAASLTTQPTLKTTATAGSHVSGSPYAITASGAVDADYTISYVPGALTVAPAKLSVTANDASKVQGAPNPTFSDTITGFVNGDTSSVVSGAANLSTAATTASAAGTYAITAALGTLSAADYNFAFQNGALTVTASTPFAVKDAVYTIGSGTVTVASANGLLASDTGPSQLSVTAGAVTGAEGGTFVFNADGAFTYTPGSNFSGYDSAQFTVTDAAGDKATQTVTVLSQHASVVWKFYESVLNRIPDPGGLAFWTNYLNNGGQTGDMAVAFFESDELLDQIVTNYYQEYLLRIPDATGLAYWVGEWQATGEPEGIKAGFADSPEFYNSAGGTPSTWLNALYQRILSRTPDPAGESYWLNYYQQQTAAGVAAGDVQQQIALGFFESAEAYGDDVTGWFNEYLDRNPTSTEQSQYASQMAGGATDRTIEQAITNLPEYANNPPAPADGAAAALPDYYQTTAQSQAAVAAKDALFAGL